MKWTRSRARASWAAPSLHNEIPRFAMIKFLLIFLAAFLVSLGGAAAVVKMRAKPAADTVAAGAATPPGRQTKDSTGAAAETAARQIAGPSAVASRDSSTSAGDHTRRNTTTNAPRSAATDTATRGQKDLRPTSGAAPAPQPGATASGRASARSPAAVPATVAPKVLATAPAKVPAKVPAKGAAAVPAVVPAAVPGAVSAAAATAPPAATGADGSGRISKIFSAMPAKEAAKVFEHMDDADVLAILGPVSNRKAAEVLALMPVARAATLSKALLRARGAAR